MSALRVRQRTTQARIGVLSTEVAKKKKDEREDRPTRKLLERAAAKEERANAKKAANAAAKVEKGEGDEDSAPLAAPKPAAKRAARAPKAKAAPPVRPVCEGQLCGHVSAKGVTCTRPFPCSSHNKKEHAEKKRRADEVAAVVDGAPAAESVVEPAVEEPGAPAAEDVVVVAVEEPGAAEDDGMGDSLAAQCAPSP